MNPAQGINKIIVVGLLSLAMAIIAVVAFAPGDHKELITILSNLASGMIGFLGSSVAHAFSLAKDDSPKDPVIPAKEGS